MLEEVVIAEFKNLGRANRFKIRVRLVERHGAVVVDVRKAINGAFTRKGIELAPAMLERLHAQIPAILCRAMAHRARADADNPKTQPRRLSTSRRSISQSKPPRARHVLRPSPPRRARGLVRER